MKFQPGQSGNPNGRPKGSVDKKVSLFKERLNALLEKSSDEMLAWLGQIEDPKERFDVLKDFAEFIHPKLARSEIQNLDGDGNPTDPVSEVRINLVDSRADNPKGV